MNRALERNKKKIDTLKKQKLVEEKHKKKLQKEESTTKQDKVGMLKILKEAKKILGII
jgi:hypothetical protein